MPLVPPSPLPASSLPSFCRFDRFEMHMLIGSPKGGRTAWSSKVVVDGHCHAARYWYDGRYLNNAKEDVAEVAYLWLTSTL